MIDNDIFEDLFVLEMANNHLGSVERGIKIINEFSQVVRFNNMRAISSFSFGMSPSSFTPILPTGRIFDT